MYVGMAKSNGVGASLLNADFLLLPPLQVKYLRTIPAIPCSHESAIGTIVCLSVALQKWKFPWLTDFQRGIRTQSKS